MKRITKVLLVAAVISLALCWAGSFPAFADPIVSVKVSDPPPTITSFFDIWVEIDLADDLYAYQFDLSFDPAILAAQSVTEGAFLAGGGATLFLPGTIDNAAGSISLTANTLLGPPPGVGGAGSLASIQFQALAEGVSPLTLSNVVLLDSSPEEMPCKTSSSSITVTGTVPEPTTLMLLGFGLIGLVGARRKR